MIISLLFFLHSSLEREESWAQKVNFVQYDIHVDQYTLKRQWFVNFNNDINMGVDSCLS